MKKTFVSNLILLMGVNLLIKPFWILGIDRGVQNHVGYVQYGIYADLFAFSMLFITLLDLGLNTYMSSNVAKNPEKLREEFTALTTFKLSSSLIYLGLTLTLGHFNGYDDDRISLLLLLGFNQILSYFYSYFRSIVGGLQYFKTDALLSVVDRSLMIIFCGLMLWFGLFEMSIQHFIYAQTLAYSVATLVAFSVIRPELYQLNWKINLTLFSKILKQMAPYALLSLLMTFYTRLDVVLIRKLAPEGDLQNGIYASAVRLLEAANMMAALVAMLLLPIFSKMISKKEDLSNLVQFSTGLMVVPAFTLSLIAYVWQQPIIRLLNNQSTDFSGHVFGLVMLCFLPLAIMYVFGTLLTANGSLRVLNKLAFIALVVNLTLNFWLIPNKQALGAAIAALVTQSFIGLTNLLFGHKILAIRFEPNFLLKLFSALTFTLVSALTLNHLDINWQLGAMVTAGIAILSMLIFRIIDLKKGLSLLKERTE
jgi:O-antigen/teichoic acid export membrane protein